MKPTAERTKHLIAALYGVASTAQTQVETDELHEAAAILRNVARAIETLQQPQDIYERAYYPAILSILTGNDVPGFFAGGD